MPSYSFKVLSPKARKGVLFRHPFVQFGTFLCVQCRALRPLQHRASQFIHGFGRHQLAEIRRGKSFGDAIQGGGDDGLAAGECLKHDQAERLGAHLRMHEAIYRVHRARHVVAVRRQPCPALQAQLLNIGAQRISHVPAADDQKARSRSFRLNSRRRLEEFALALATRQGISADDGEGVVVRLQTPFAALRFAFGFVGPKFSVSIPP